MRRRLGWATEQGQAQGGGPGGVRLRQLGERRHGSDGCGSQRGPKRRRGSVRRSSGGGGFGAAVAPTDAKGRGEQREREPERDVERRVAEEVIFGQENVTTGASNDFIQVSRVARQMVERFGFSKKIGQVAIGGPGGNPFLGQQMSSQDYSMATTDVVDAEVRELVEKAYSRATQIITTHIDILHKLAQLLIEKETVDGEEFMSLFIDGQAELFVA
ncbi:unnamed protein product [Miscanthus lutarioriparius]|uniref:Peptidase M41 domain-containing protein n=1 Tax=Miscanthus lutarioriparius TaxID=422564 RepID=A0A811S9H3_9POAL|nr:unnamed protein product [Miscanthus lutarioriparius]